MNVHDKLKDARQVAREAYAKGGLSKEYEDAMDTVSKLAQSIPVGPLPDEWCESDGKWYI